ncbi:MAG: DNA polymerase III subunit delta [Prevotella sp.]|nr:DNA polymerase III subunit delta [Bacteroides sp.]MCM1365671.1 DNA polymerase III subunit delta [Prevotella sp.]
MGDEPYYIDKIVDALEKRVVSKEFRDFNSITYYGADSQIDVVIAAAQQLPMMSDRHLVLLKEAQGMPRAKTVLDNLAPYISNPNRQCVLVLAYKGEQLAATSALIKSAAKSDAVIFKSTKLRDYQLGAPIKDYCAEKKITIDDAAIQMLGDYVGTSLEGIFGAIDKILLSQKDGIKKITPSDIAANIGMSKDYNPFELVNAISRKNYSKAQLILHFFKRNPNGNPTPVIATQLFNFFVKLTLTHLNHDKSDEGLISVTGAKNSYALKDIKNAMSHYNLNQCMHAISAIRDFDCKSKGIDSLQNGHELLSDLIFSIFTFR